MHSRVHPAPRGGAPGRRPQPTLPPAAALVARYGGGGNRALARIVELSARPRRPAARRLARFAITVTTRGAGTIDDELLIDRVQIGDRPPGVFGGRPRSHTVGWETFCDALRFEIMGQTPDVALQRVEALYQLAQQLPSMMRTPELAQHRPPRADEGATERHDRAALRAHRAHAAAQAPIARPNDYDDDFKIGALQEFATAYLMLRNTVPLSAVDLDHPSGGADMDVLRDHETGAANHPPLTLRAALWAHLDKRAVALLASATVTPAQAPGVDAAAGDVEQAGRVVSVIGDHLISMNAAYPVCFAAAQMRALDSIAGFLATVVPFPGLWIDPVAKAVTADALPTLPDHPGRRPGIVVSDTGKRFSVQFVTEVRGTDVVVKEMHTGGRPIGVFGTGSPGSHTTAWIALCDSVRALALGKTVAAAHAALVAYGNTVRDPVQERVDALEDKAPWALQVAQYEYDEAVALDDPVPDLLRIQAIARGILMVLNAHPLSALYRGGLANPADEGGHRDAARQANVAGPPIVGNARQTLREEMWGLFDHGTLGKVLEFDPILQDMPGAIEDEDPSHRGAYLIDHHLDVIERAYPHAFARSAFDDLSSVAWILDRSTATNDVSAEVCLLLRYDRDDVKQRFPVSKKRKHGGGGTKTKKQKTSA